MKKILIIAGEASGDLHGSNLVREVRKLDPRIGFFGVGSKRMREAGVELLADASEISVVGATEVLTHLSAIYKVYSRLKKFLKQERPDLVVLIDFPDFNILLGTYAKRLGLPVLYYISPQVWAWRKGRIKKIARMAKAIIVVFPFEVPLYEDSGVDVRFVGHPLTDVVRSAYTQAEARNSLGLDSGRRTVALLPGSRSKEIEGLLPDMLSAAVILKRRFPGLQFILPVAPTLRPDLVKEYIDRGGVPVLMVNGRVYDALRASDAAIVASGTATLETGLMEVPLVIVYRVSRLSYWIGRMLVDIKNVGLVNIVAGRRIAPELIQRDATPAKIAEATAGLLDDPAAAELMRGELASIRSRLGEAGASARAASIVLELLGTTTTPVNS